ncbi:Ldh family oxidoreductase [Adhaeribacter sp. BT258]|uniref:Ldh family oxidoreductase n=1 Tax=Adhaeribacter terrigena TaxID=2793070 RepID=A0ABS1BX47_9BACT|nr:Ldh family oxidoreductase [Adhaeribacter terrigena]MBK0401437.1 Ldh family oxidoreductase [Adhaeribacter terrigena]
MFSYNHLFHFTEQVFLAMGCPEDDARLATESLLAADLRGVDSHGIARLIGYVRLWDAGRINARPEIRIVHQTPSTATIDGDAGLGLVVAPRVMDMAIQKAEIAGSGWISVKNSNHFGIAGYHAMRALPHNMIGWAMTNASPLVSPTNGLDRLLGTNPIAIAIPANEEPDFILDMATTTAANGKLEVLQRKKQAAPIGWIQTKFGLDSTNPDELKLGGAMLPLGGASASYKGYGLGSVVDIFSAVLSGANYGPWVPPFVSFLPLPENPVGEGIGHFLGAMRVDAFRPADEFKAHMDNWIQTFRNSKAKPGEKVMIPGDPERITSEQRLQEGIHLLDPVIKDLEELAKKFSLTF